jgi:glycosyltransferase involved in cell wall biosynthesis
MDSQKLLTIAIPTFERDVWLDNSLERLIPQLIENVSDVELVISNNASSDKTDEVIEKYNDSFEITYNKNIENIGAIRNIYKCLSLSSGKYVWILGDDDFMEKGYLKKIIELIKHYENIPFFYVPNRAWFPDKTFHIGNKIVMNDDFNESKFKNTQLEIKEHKMLKVIADYDKGYLTSLCCNILLKEDYLKAFEFGDNIVNEFTSVQTTYPHAYYLATKCLNYPCIEVFSVGLISSHSVSWSKYFEITWLRWYPELIILMAKNGADPKKALIERKRIITFYPVMIIKLIKKDIANYNSFSYYQFFKDNFWIRDFWAAIFNTTFNKAFRKIKKIWI